MVECSVETKFHTPVMLNEVLAYLDLAPGKVIIDATLGTGGHGQAILERISPGGKLIGIDRDNESLNIARDRLDKFKDSCVFVHGNFSDIERILEEIKVRKVDGVLFDFGISSFQLDDPERGFSFGNDGPLDMRLDRDSYISAYDLINNLNEEELSTLLWNFGEERWHNRIARHLVEERQKHPISTTSELADIVSRSIPARYRHKFYRIHPATRTFQAVRIAVNRELEILDNALNHAIEVLDKKGRICAISFHSLEDRAVKLNFRKKHQESKINILTPKPLTPTQSEVEANPRSRSSKLRAAGRV